MYLINLCNSCCRVLLIAATNKSEKKSFFSNIFWDRRDSQATVCEKDKESTPMVTGLSAPASEEAEQKSETAQATDSSTFIGNTPTSSTEEDTVVVSKSPRMYVELRHDSLQKIYPRFSLVHCKFGVGSCSVCSTDSLVHFFLFSRLIL